MRLIVVGAGAIGAPIGGLLFEAGTDVVLVARGEHGRALAERGLDLRLPSGSRTLRPEVVGHWREADPTAGDLVLLAVMGQHSLEALDGMGTEVPVASFQNGTAPLDALAARGNPLVAAMVYIPAERRAPGVVALTGTPHPGAVILGPWTGAPEPPGVAGWLRDRLVAVGLVAEFEPAMEPWIRAKLLTNLAGIVVALSDGGGRATIEAAQDEARAAWRAAGLPFREPAELIARIGPLGSAPVDGIERVGGSSRHALARGQGLETRSLHGPICALGRELGVPTPVNDRLIALAEQAVAEGWRPGARPLDQVGVACRGVRARARARARVRERWGLRTG